MKKRSSLISRRNVVTGLALLATLTVLFFLLKREFNQVRFVKHRTPSCVKSPVVEHVEPIEYTQRAEPIEYTQRAEPIEYTQRIEPRVTRTNFVTNTLPCHYFQRCQPCNAFDCTVTSGYVWKDDEHFREFYADGIWNIVTLDTSWWFAQNYGIGLKGSYWAANGNIPVVNEPTHTWEVPLAFSLKGRIGSRLQAYGSIGVDFIIVNETNFLGKANQTGWGGEVEVGANYYLYKNIFFNAACRYIYCRKYIATVNDHADFGGLDLRGGLGISF